LKLTHRIFSISEKLDSLREEDSSEDYSSEDYRIEILTDHNDEKVVGWVMFVD
jgi:hypothetical protein